MNMSAKAKQKSEGAMRKLRILHAPKNIAGQATVISRAQRKLGHQSDVLVHNNPYGYECDFDLKLDRSPLGLLKAAVVLPPTFLYCAAKYDVFHFHYGQSLLPFNIDLPILKLLGKKMVMHYWGSDLIQLDLAEKYTALSPEELRKIYPHAKDEETRLRLKWVSNYATIILGGYSLLPYYKDAEVVGVSVDLERLNFSLPKVKKGPLAIVHAPTNREIKGTKCIVEAIERLRKKHPVKFTIVENVAHDNLLRIFRDADIVVDDVKQGPYGAVSIECMALGRPVVDYIHENLRKYYPRVPVVEANQNNLYEMLLELVEKPELRKKIALAGRRFVEQNHDATANAKKLEEIYSRKGP